MNHETWPISTGRSKKLRTLSHFVVFSTISKDMNSPGTQLWSGVTYLTETVKSLKNGAKRRHS